MLLNYMKKLFFASVDLEKPFDWVPREVIHFALRQKVDGDMSLYKDCNVKLLLQLAGNYQVRFL